MTTINDMTRAGTGHPGHAPLDEPFVRGVVDTVPKSTGEIPRILGRRRILWSVWAAP